MDNSERIIINCPTCMLRHVIFGIIITIIIAFISLSNPNYINAISISEKPPSDNWVTIRYGELIDRSTLTHSGETVGRVVQKITRRSDNFKDLVQPYLEPYSILCHDKLLSIVKTDAPALVNILTHYPVGSEQPAWADLFREGHFQLYYNADLIRVFLKGTAPESSFEKFHSVIRHPIQDVINSEGTSIKNIEVYVFTNNYAATEIRLNTVPITYAINDIDLTPKRKSIDIDSIDEFLKIAVIWEAVEVDNNNNLFFYGKRIANQTIADQPVSISDIAVVYRSVFHYGYNPPYISLDKHEDNRYAKVNFGGHLENSRVGHVVLEADKLFKMLSTGIDPNTFELVQSKITKEVPDFLTEDERGFLGGIGQERSQIRYWFYPDDIGTVTDGSIGAVSTYQFLADTERMDINVGFDRADRETIEHLNTNYAQYERVENAYKELNTVGRIMALVNWLREMKMGERIELDDLLSVKIPAFSTPKKTKKMMAITTIAYPEDSRISSQNVRDYTKTFYISHLLEEHSPFTSDEEFLRIANTYFSQIDVTELYPPQYKKLAAKGQYYEGLIRSHTIKLKSLQKELERKKETLDEYSATEIEQFNSLINDYNELLANKKALIKAYNANSNELNSMNIKPRMLSSIGGGISLDPTKFKKTVVNKNAPQIREIASMKSQLKPSGNISRSGNWIRSNSETSGARINKLPNSINLP